MLVLVSYDVNTNNKSGQRRLRRISKVCKDYGQRVQYSVFECVVDPTQWVKLKQKLLNEIDIEKDSLRFYFLGSNWKNRIGHVGAKESINIEGPLIF
jgi:CRISPR-associated protein Cas2